MISISSWVRLVVTVGAAPVGAFPVAPTIDHIRRGGGGSSWWACSDDWSARRLWVTGVGEAAVVALLRC